MELPPLPFDVWTLTIGGAQLIPSIIFLLQVLKSFNFIRNRATGDGWRTFAYLLSVAGVLGAFHDQNALPTTIGGWSVTVIIGLVVGWLVQLSYDQTLRNRTSERPPAIYQSMFLSKDEQRDLAQRLAGQMAQPPKRDPEKAKAYFESLGATVEEKTEPVELGKSHSGTSDSSEG